MPQGLWPATYVEDIARWGVWLGRHLRGFLAIHNNFSNRTALRWRWFIQISALSTFDGWVLASHGDNGSVFTHIRSLLTNAPSRLRLWDYFI